jgi:hypothetical protein
VVGSQAARHPGQNRHPGTHPEAKALSPRVEAAEKLRDEIQRLKTDLDLTLMVVYLENGYWDEFLDVYLQFLQEAPENRLVGDWLRDVLRASEHCGRTEEITESLRHFVRYHSHSKTATALSAMLLEWELEYRGKRPTDTQ